MIIEDIPLSEMANLSSGKRKKSQETEEFITVLKRMKTKDAKAIMVDDKNTVPKITSRLRYVARLAGVKLQIVNTSEKVMFMRTKQNTKTAQSKS